MYITHQSLYFYTELASACVIFVAYCGMVNLLTISSNLNIYMNIYIYITNLNCVECHNTVDPTITKRYRIDIDDIDSNTADPTIMKRYSIDIESISMISTAIQLIGQSWNDIVSISNRYRQQYSWSNKNMTISYRFRRYRKYWQQYSWYNRNMTMPYRYRRYRWYRQKYS